LILLNKNYYDYYYYLLNLFIISLGGKSAILTGITVCLGGKANVTNRASNLKSLIREGAK
jgi:hypothetical protein